MTNYTEIEMGWLNGMKDIMKKHWIFCSEGGDMSIAKKTSMKNKPSYCLCDMNERAALDIFMQQYDNI